MPLLGHFNRKASFVLGRPNLAVKCTKIDLSGKKSAKIVGKEIGCWRN
jgi:hypothetical protein